MALATWTRRGAGTGRLVRVIHRPGSVQTEIRIGHPGLPRRIPDFHALSVMSAILGGLFNSRLNMQLREAKGYTYGAGAGFDLRRGAGPFTARAAVNTEVTVPAIVDTLAELDRMRAEPVTDAELAAARDFLVGVFPLRFETPGAVAGALTGLAVHGLPLDELVRYREAHRGRRRGRRRRLRPGSTSTSRRPPSCWSGDVDAFGPELEAAGLGRIVIERDEVPALDGPVAEDEAAAAVAPADAPDDLGPTAGAEEPDLPGTSDDPVAADREAP